MKKLSGIMTGMGIGLAIGGTGAFIGSTMMSGNTKKTLKKKAAKTFKTMESFMDDIQYMFK
ncbi:MAG: hypothetical protein ACI4GA_03845 [Acutalibacteraceae bacterium]|nr:hypothetical protein [Oscillospiraceae bacterium]